MFAALLRADGGKYAAAAGFRRLERDIAEAHLRPAVFVPSRRAGYHQIGAELLHAHAGGGPLLQIMQRSVVDEQERVAVGKAERDFLKALYAPRRLQAGPAQLHRAGKKSAQPAVNRVGGDLRAEVISPNLGRRGVGAEISKADQGARTVRRIQEQSFRQHCRRKAHHFRVLTGGNKGAVRFRDHKDAIEGQTALLYLGMGEL